VAPSGPGITDIKLLFARSGNVAGSIPVMQLPNHGRQLHSDEHLHQAEVGLLDVSA